MAEIRYEELSPLIDYINQNNYTWKAKLNSRFSGLTLSQIRNKEVGNSNKNFFKVKKSLS